VQVCYVVLLVCDSELHRCDLSLEPLPKQGLHAEDLALDKDHQVRLAHFHFPQVLGRNDNKVAVLVSHHRIGAGHLRRHSHGGRAVNSAALGLRRGSIS